MNPMETFRITIYSLKNTQHTKLHFHFQHLFAKPSFSKLRRSTHRTFMLVLMTLFILLGTLVVGHTMAPYAGDLDAENPKSKKKQKEKVVGHEIGVFLTDLHHILHARSCNHFLWFPHTPGPPRPLKRPQNFNLLFEFFQLLLFWFTF